MNELTITVQGWVATSPKYIVTKNGPDIVSFRLATTARYFDRNADKWVDKSTQWFTVRVFRAAAVLIEKSIQKGQPVIVVGRFQANEWESNSGPRVDLVIDATTVGHDLTRGVASFRRATVDPGTNAVQDVVQPVAVEAAEPQEAPPVNVTDLVEVLDEDLEPGEPEEPEPAAHAQDEPELAVARS